MDVRPRAIKIKEAAKILGIGVRQCEFAAKRGELKTIRIGRTLLVLAEPLEKMLAGENPPVVD